MCNFMANTCILADVQTCHLTCSSRPTDLQVHICNVFRWSLHMELHNLVHSRDSWQPEPWWTCTYVEMCELTFYMLHLFSIYPVDPHICRPTLHFLACLQWISFPTWVYILRHMHADIVKSISRQSGTPWIAGTKLVADQVLKVLDDWWHRSQTGELSIKWMRSLSIYIYYVAMQLL